MEFTASQMAAINVIQLFSIIQCHSLLGSSAKPNMCLETLQKMKNFSRKGFFFNVAKF